MAVVVQDLREGGRWTVLQRWKNDVVFGLVCVALAIAVRLPTAWLRLLGRFVGACAWALLFTTRRRTESNIARVLPELAKPARADLVRRVFRELGVLLGEAVASLDPRRPAAPPIPFLPGARECLDAAIAEGHGVVFASAHLGPWERVAASLVAHGMPLTVVAREPYDPRLSRVYDRLRKARGVRTVYRGAGGAGIALVRVLRKGDVLGIPMDLASRVPSIDVPFLGRSASTPVGPARLALKTGAAVVVGTAARADDGSLGISFVRIALPQTQEEDNPLRLPDQHTREKTLTTRINDELSARIRAMPEAWLWMHDRWNRA